MDPNDANQDPELARLESMIAADEAAESEGRSTSGDSADSAGNASLTFVPLDQVDNLSATDEPSSSGTRTAEPAAPAKPAAKPPTTAKPTATAAKPAAQQGQQQQKATGQQGQQGQQQPEPSRYQKSKEREARAWKEINERKLELEAQAAKLEGERAEIERVRTSPPSRQQQQQPNDLTSRDFAEAAVQLDKEADAHELRGDFDAADKSREMAQKARTRASQLQQQSRQNGASQNGQGGPQSQLQEAQQQAWNKAKTEFPEIVDASNPANKALRDFIRSHPRVLDYTEGPYLAAALVVAQQRAANVPNLQQEAARVPELQKQVETLTAKLNELQARTALPSSHTPTSAMSARGETSWTDLSTDEMERHLDRELADA
jgi:hypothetical protein